MKCVNHFEKDAAGVCNHCGKSICSDCFVEIKGEMYCKDCLAVKTGQLKKEERSPALAAILSFVIPGLGQIYNGQVGKGIAIFFTCWLIIPWIVGIFDAYNIASKIQQGKLNIKSQPGCLIAFVIGSIFFVFISIFMVALLAAIAIPNLLRARVNANTSAAGATVRTISSAIESYKAANNGQYPVDESQLVQSTPAYLSDSYNNKSYQGYKYSVNLEPGGYKIIAQPLNCHTTGNKVFTIENGQEMSAQECKEQPRKEGEDD